MDASDAKPKGIVKRHEGTVLPPVVPAGPLALCAQLERIEILAHVIGREVGLGIKREAPENQQDENEGTEPEKIALC